MLTPGSLVVPDAGVWIDYFNHVKTAHTETLLWHLGRYELVTTDIIILEVLQGFRFDRDYENARRILDDLTRYTPFHGRQNMELAASNYRFLRKKGITIRKPNDVIIGTFCIQEGYWLLHNDQDFVQVRLRGLASEFWA
jgi:predicted nucleic acid-binding protein